MYYPFVGGDPLLAGLAAGVALAAIFGWRRSRGIDNIWQRGVIAVLAAVGALLVGFLAALAHGLGGVVGLVVWGAASLALGIVGSQWAVRGSGE
jgi:preprotein translocase subunit SecY